MAKQSRSARYYAKNKEKCLAAAARWRAANPDYSKRYREANREKLCENQRNFYARHSERVKAQVLRGRRVRPEAHRARERKRRAQKLAVAENFTVEMEQFVRAFWHMRCAICGETAALCFDHWLPLSRGYALTVHNAVLLCRPCNSSKSSKLPESVYTSEQVTTIEHRLVKQAEQWELVVQDA